MLEKNAISTLDQIFDDTSSILRLRTSKNQSAMDIYKNTTCGKWNINSHKTEHERSLLKNFGNSELQMAEQSPRKTNKLKILD